MSFVTERQWLLFFRVGLCSIFFFINLMETNRFQSTTGGTSLTLKTIAINKISTRYSDDVVKYIALVKKKLFFFFFLSNIRMWSWRLNLTIKRSITENFMITITFIETNLRYIQKINKPLKDILTTNFYKT